MFFTWHSFPSVQGLCHLTLHRITEGLPRWLRGKEPACQFRRCNRCRFDPWVKKIPWRRTEQPTPIFLPGESRGLRSLVGSSPPDHRESDMNEWLSTNREDDVKTQGEGGHVKVMERGPELILPSWILGGTNHASTLILDLSPLELKMMSVL